MIYLDTHTVVWLYAGDISKLSQKAKEAVNEHSLIISPMVSLEMTYLHEIGRLNTDMPKIVSYLKETVGLEICSIPFGQVIDCAVKQTWTRDPFDRVIVGHAAVTKSGLITKDEMIRKHYEYSVW